MVCRITCFLFFLGLTDILWLVGLLVFCFSLGWQITVVGRITVVCKITCLLFFLGLTDYCGW